MKDKKIVFVILHYLVEKETVKCIESILENIDSNNFDIVIVDNCSPNNSGDNLVKKYKSNKKIHVIKTNSNLGFTGGNNIGFSYAKNNLNADFICMMNNDTYIIQKDFFEVIINEYNKSRFAVMGPKIFLPKNQVEKVTLNLITKRKLKLNSLRLKALIISNYMHIESLFLKLEKQLKLKLGYNKNKKNGIIHRKEQVVLHGCCLVFSPIYIKKFDGLDQKTFLYREEEFLFIKIKLNNLISVYNDKLRIFHNEKQATMLINKKIIKSKIKRYKNLLKANKVLLKYMVEEGIGD